MIGLRQRGEPPQYDDEDYGYRTRSIEDIRESLKRAREISKVAEKLAGEMAGEIYNEET